MKLLSYLVFDHGINVEMYCLYYYKYLKKKKKVKTI